MSMTNSQFIRDCLGLLGELAETQSASVEQVELGMRVTNETMASWKKDGIDLQYTPQSVAGDTIPIPDEAISAAKHFVAFALAPYFGSTVSQALLSVGQSLYDTLVREAMKDQIVEVRSDTLPWGDGQRAFRDISSF